MRIRDIDPSLASRPKLDSGVSIRARSLADRHLEDLTPGEIAFCLRQGIAVPAVMDRAIHLLASQPFVEAELYPGDLLGAAIHAETKGWLNSDQSSALRAIRSAADEDESADSGGVVLTVEDSEKILEVFCVKYGFCLTPEWYDRLANAPPDSAKAYVDAAILAYGLDPEGVDQRMRSEMQDVVRQAVERTRIAGAEPKR